MKENKVMEWFSVFLIFFFCAVLACCVHSSRACWIMNANLSCSPALSTLLRAFIKMQKASLKSSHSEQVDDMHNCDVLPRIMWEARREREKERERAESSDEMLTAQGTLRIQREFCLMRIGRISDGGTHIFGKEEHHYSGPVISVVE